MRLPVLHLAAGIALLSAMSVTAAATQEFTETKAQKDARMKWFREAKFGMFIHWGLYSQLAGEWNGREIMGGAEWIQNMLAIPTSQYRPLAKTWNPSKYEPRAWAKMARAAGMKYICITTKHHDGFNLWPTKQNDDWNVAASTPFRRDLLKPLAEACRAEGLKFCVYYSVLDWHHADWPARPGYNDLAKGTPDKQRYKTEYLYPQLKELLTGYGDVGMVWLDGTWEKEWTSQDGKELEAAIRAMRPSVIINNRSGYKPPQPKLDFNVANAYGYIFAGDYISPEGEVPPTGLPGIDWESCQTMQLPNNWGYSRLVGFRATKALLHELIDITSKGGNFLLNVGPTAEGVFPPQAVERLQAFAKWMQVNKESIHGTTASPFSALPFNGRCTQKERKLYFHVFDWPKDGKIVIPMRNAVKRAWLLAAPGTELATETNPSGTTVRLPADAPDALSSTVVVEVESAVEPIPINLLSQRAKVTVSGEWAGREKELTKAHIADGSFATTWAAPEIARSAWIELELDAPGNVHTVVLSDSPYHRTQEFTLEAWVDGAWKPVATGREIGSRLSLSFSPVQAKRFRLSLVKTRDTPTLAEFQFFGG